MCVCLSLCVSDAHTHRDTRTQSWPGLSRVHSTLCITHTHTHTHLPAGGQGGEAHLRGLEQKVKKLRQEGAGPVGHPLGMRGHGADVSKWLGHLLRTPVPTSRAFPQMFHRGRSLPSPRLPRGRPAFRLRQAPRVICGLEFPRHDRGRWALCQRSDRLAGRGETKGVHPSGDECLRVNREEDWVGLRGGVGNPVGRRPENLGQDLKGSKTEAWLPRGSCLQASGSCSPAQLSSESDTPLTPGWVRPTGL